MEGRAPSRPPLDGPRAQLDPPFSLSLFTRRNSQNPPIAFSRRFAHTVLVVVSLHSKSVRRLSAACLALWLVAFLTCSLHCTLGSFTTKAASSAHSCCSGKAASADAPATPVTNGNCHAFRDLAASDAANARVDFTPQLVAVVAPILISWITAPTVMELKPRAPEPDSGPPSHRPLLRLAGRAPPVIV